MSLRVRLIWGRVTASLAASVCIVLAGCGPGTESLATDTPAVPTAVETFPPAASAAATTAVETLPPEEATLMPQFSAKFSSPLKQMISEIQPDENPELNLLVQVTSSPTPQQLKQIEDLSGEVRTTAGNILTLTLPFESLQKLASLEFVKVIELSGPLYPEP